MSASSQLLPHEHTLSLKTEVLVDVLTQVENILIIQDLDGVCMGLVKDPLTRVIDRNYVKATQAFEGHFYVLTNGEHIGERGVNGIIERAFGNSAEVKAKGLYLPGLAGGGVQWQDRQGNVSHPGVSEAELEFLAEVPQIIKRRLRRFFEQRSTAAEIENLEDCIQASVLENKASPSANLNTFYDQLREYPQIYMDLQKDMQNLMQELLQEAKIRGLSDSFFVHYAPNLGRDLNGQELLRPAQGQDSGTTDFQFMLQGAIKEAGVLGILNRYYFQRTGSYPLGEEFNVRQAPKTLEELLALVKENFDPKDMPLMIGVGDTVNSSVEDIQGRLMVRRGGSDRNFLQLIQTIGRELDTGNIIVYIDSSQGEVKNRKSVKIGQHETSGDEIVVLEGPGDVRDVDEPLTLNFVFHKGHQQYNEFFQKVARERKASDHR
ncbi:glucosylglycerol 3-phosphatase [Coleofasciculus sp.]|uniref:glucosylglycerol 3-phosphatase n=1 Tax=Coleofasciculus sp. TaxID=3100458 RepID=UPI0039F763D2